MARTVDARGLSCPQPVLLARAAMGRGEFPIEVLVDTAASCENVRRVAEKAGLRVSVEAQGDGFKLLLSRSSEAGNP